MTAGCLQKLCIFRVINDIDDSRESGDEPFRYGTAIDIGEHADRRTVDQDVTALGVFQILVIDGIGANPLNKGVKFCIMLFIV